MLSTWTRTTLRMDGMRSIAAAVLDILDYSMDRILPETRGNVYAVVGHHTDYKGAVRPMMLSKRRPWKFVDGDKYSSHEMYAYLLHTHDYVASAVRRTSN